MCNLLLLTLEGKIRSSGRKPARRSRGAPLASPAGSGAEPKLMAKGVWGSVMSFPSGVWGFRPRRKRILVSFIGIFQHSETRRLGNFAYISWQFNYISDSGRLIAHEDESRVIFESQIALSQADDVTTFLSSAVIFILTMTISKNYLASSCKSLVLWGLAGPVTVCTKDAASTNDKRLLSVDLVSCFCSLP